MKRNYLWIGLIGLGLFASCGGNGNKTAKTSDSTSTTKLVQSISKPFSNLEIGFKSFEIDVSQAQKLELSASAELTIPADAFVDDKQQPVKGKVTIEYRQFNTLAEIMASGISMAYDSAGTKFNFQTAGMFELKGSSYGKSVFIKPDKQLEMKMKSKMAGDFNFYKLDAKGSNSGWKYENTTRTFKENTPQRDESERLISSKKATNNLSEPSKPVKFDSNKDIALQIIPTKSWSEIQSLKGAMWKYAGDKDPKEIAKLFKLIWTTTEIKLKDKEKMLYEVTLKKGDATETVLVTPALIGKRYEEAMKAYENSKKEYEKKLVLLKNQQNQQLQQDKIQASDELFSRTASVNGFGIYNYDRCYRAAELTILNANFKLDKKEKEEVTLVYLVSPKENAVIRFYSGNFDKFNFNPKTDNKIVAILPNNKVAILTTKEFAQLQAQLKGKPDYTFALKEYAKPMNNVQDLEELLGSI